MVGRRGRRYDRCGPGSRAGTRATITTRPRGRTPYAPRARRQVGAEPAVWARRPPRDDAGLGSCSLAPVCPPACPPEDAARDPRGTLDTRTRSRVDGPPLAFQGRDTPQSVLPRRVAERGEEPLATRAGHRAAQPTVARAVRYAENNNKYLKSVSKRRASPATASAQAVARVASLSAVRTAGKDAIPLFMPLGKANPSSVYVKKDDEKTNEKTRAQCDPN